MDKNIYGKRREKTGPSKGEPYGLHYYIMQIHALSRKVKRGVGEGGPDGIRRITGKLARFRLMKRLSAIFSLIQRPHPAFGLPLPGGEGKIWRRRSITPSPEGYGSG